jgi:hypothetical protein
MARLTAEQLNASAEHDFDFREEEVDVPQLGGSILLRELDVKRRSKLLNGLLDENGNVKDVAEMNVRMFAASCVDPPVGSREARKFIPKWPATVYDAAMEPLKRLGGDAGEEVSKAETEFPDTDD